MWLLGELWAMEERSEEGAVVDKKRRTEGAVVQAE